MNIAGNPNVVDIMFHADRYEVDVNTLEIVLRAPDAATEAVATDETAEPSGSGSSSLGTWLVVTGVAIAGSLLLGGALWRSRQG